VVHGGGGPETTDGFAALFATRYPVRTIDPIHPGFRGTPRPEKLSTIGQLADLYVALIEQIDLEDVTLIGNSIGGWIAVGMTLRGHPVSAVSSSSTT
jgi:pimeloyl-ACP methyl ester carboxylesterase